MKLVFQNNFLHSSILQEILWKYQVLGEYILVKIKYHKNNVASKYKTCADQSSDEKVLLQKNKDESVNINQYAEQKFNNANVTAPTSIICYSMLYLDNVLYNIYIYIYIIGNETSYIGMGTYIFNHISIVGYH